MKTPVVYGLDKSLLMVPIDQGGSIETMGRFRRVLREAARESENLICYGNIPIDGSVYRVSLWRRGNRILTVARSIRTKSIVHDKGLLELLQDELLRDEAGEAIGIELENQGIDSWSIGNRLYEELVDSTVTTVHELMCRPREAARLVIMRMLVSRRNEMPSPMAR